MCSKVIDFRVVAGSQPREGKGREGKGGKGESL